MADLIKLPDDVVGGTGSFFAAVLESAGLHAQSEILTSFEPAFSSIGALIYLWGLVAAIGSVAIWGNYKKGMFFLICPVIFWWMLQTRDTAKGAIHIFGDRVEQGFEERKEKILIENNIKKVDLPKVSYFFKRYDRLVTSLVQQTVRLVIDTDRQRDVINEGKALAYRKLTGLQNWDPNYIKLLGYGLIGSCHEMARLQFELAGQAYERLNVSKEGCNIGTGPEGELLYQGDKNTIKDIKELEFEYLGKCNNLLALKKKRVTIHESLQDYITSMGFDFNDGKHQCVDVWKWIRVASRKFAGDVLKNPQYQQFVRDNPEVNWEQVYNEVMPKLQPPGKDGAEKPADILEATDVLASFIFRNTVVHGPLSRIAMSQTGRGDWDPKFIQEDGVGILDNEARVNRLLIFYFASIVPYMQGVILYLLTMAFPFFCFFLLIPDRVSSFFIWMTLWLWVKSWDVGFAFVHFFREIYWNLMPHLANNRDLGSVSKFEWNPDNPDLMLAIIFRNDPGASVVTYYTIVSLLTVSIPFITAHLCMGATNLYDSLKTGIDGTANRFSGDVKRELNRRYADRAEARKAAVHQAINNSVQDRMSNTLDNPLESQAAKLRAIRREQTYQQYRFGHSAEGKRLHQQLAMYTGRLDPLQMLRGSAGLESVLKAMASEINDREHNASHNIGNDAAFGKKAIGTGEAFFAGENRSSTDLGANTLFNNESTEFGASGGYSKGDLDEETPDERDGD